MWPPRWFPLLGITGLLVIVWLVGDFLNEVDNSAGFSEHLLRGCLWFEEEPGASVGHEGGKASHPPLHLPRYSHFDD